MKLSLLTLLEKDASSAVFHDTLLHCESLSVVSAGDLKDVALVVLSHHFTIDFLAHSPVEERTAAYNKVWG